MKDYKEEAIALSALDLWTIASHPEAPVNYIYTPKNASSSIMASFLGADSNPHEAFVSKFVSGPIDLNKPFFCVTRNPYDRILSAYLDKIGPDKDPAVWEPFCVKYALDPGSTLEFSRFLEIISNDSRPQLLDFHFRPQFYTNNFAFVRPMHVFRLERMDDLTEFLKSNDIDHSHYSPHAQGASVRRKSITPQQAEVIRDLYRLDFEHYGYDERVESDFVPSTIVQAQRISSELARVSGIRGRVDDVELRTLAGELTSRCYLQAARSLWQIVLMLNHQSLDDVLQFEEACSGLTDQSPGCIETTLLIEVLKLRQAAIHE